jgi:uncharacterized protein YciI
MAQDASPSAHYYVVFMTTKFQSMAQVQSTAPAELASHLARSKQLHEAGVLLMAGAFLDHPEQPVQTMGVLASRQSAEEYARQDPFVQAGMVSGHTIRKWANMFA